MSREAFIRTRPRRFREGGEITVEAVIMHPMENGMRKNATGVTVPLHHVTDFEVYYGDEQLFVMKVSRSLSSNPGFTFPVVVTKEADLRCVWKDNRGERTEVIEKISFS